MSCAILKINWQPKRMLTQSEAAHHCGRSLSRFKIECPVQQVRFLNDDLRISTRIEI